MSAGEPGSVVRRMLLGSHLRRLRESRGITREAAGYSIRASESKISRMELGRVSFKTRDVEDLLTLYGVTDEAERNALLSLAREANVAGWWHSYSDVLPGWFQTYVGPGGRRIADPRLRSAVRARPVADRGVRTCSRRTRHEGREPRPTSSAASPCAWSGRSTSSPTGGPQFHVVLDEAALRRPYGDREVMRGQLQHLIEVSERPNVTAADHAVRLRRTLGRERRVHDAELPGVRPVRRRSSWSSSPARCTWTRRRKSPSTRRR